MQFALILHVLACTALVCGAQLAPPKRPANEVLYAKDVYFFPRGITLGKPDLAVFHRVNQQLARSQENLRSQFPRSTANFEKSIRSLIEFNVLVENYEIMEDRHFVWKYLKLGVMNVTTQDQLKHTYQEVTALMFDSMNFMGMVAYAFQGHPIPEYATNEATDFVAAILNWLAPDVLRKSIVIRLPGT